MKKLLFALSFILLTACSGDDLPKDYTEDNENEMLTYIADNNLNAEKSDTGIYYVIDEEGTGDFPISSDIVKVNYTGYFTNGTVFTQSADNGTQLTLQKILLGLAYGIPQFKTGGSGKIIIPSRLAYGNSDYGSIPGGSVLVFDIELLAIYSDIDTANDTEIVDYLAENDLTDTAVKTDSGLYYIIEGDGTGEYPTSSDNVTVAYKGYYTNGTIFDQSSVSGVSFNLQSVIKGWTEGIPYFKTGGSGKLLVPSSLGYGSDDYSTIPGGSVLVFDINLISID